MAFIVNNFSTNNNSYQTNMSPSNEMTIQVDTRIDVYTDSVLCQICGSQKHVIVPKHQYTIHGFCLKCIQSISENAQQLILKELKK